MKVRPGLSIYMWRNIPVELREAIREQAKKEGITTKAWLMQVAREALRNAKANG